MSSQGKKRFQMNKMRYSLDNPDNGTFHLTLKLLSYDRLFTLQRCLLSLAKAKYDDDIVDLHIYIDHFPASLNNTQQVQRQINAESMLSYASAFVWQYGRKRVIYRTANHGIQGSWLESWWPTTYHEYVFMVEDDMELSKN